MRAHISCLLMLLLPAVASADRGALSVDAGGGMAALRLPAPYAEGSPTLDGFTPTVGLGARYALSNALELTASGFFELPANFFHNGVTVTRDGTAYTGTLSHRMYRYGAAVGARLVLGMVWRPFLGVEAGWSHRVSTNLQHVDDSNPAYPQDYFLGLDDFSRDNLSLAVSLGLQWVGDNFSITLAPRAEYLLGVDAMPVVSLPLAVGWSWYL